MAYFDMAKELLRSYTPRLELPDDASEFWAATLRESRAIAAPTTWRPVVTGLTAIDTFDVTFSGFGGQAIKAWLQIPANGADTAPGVVTFQGYGGGRGLPVEVSHFALAGYPTLVMDTRGQGAAWKTGETPDPEGTGSSHPGFMTRGILDPAGYYYRRLYADAALAVDALRSHPRVQRDRVAVAGVSQGGGVALAAAALVPDVWCVLADVPFLCDFPRATQLVDTDPYGEIVRFLKVHRDHESRVFETLAYFDAAALSPLASAPALFSVALMDDVCPPSTVYAAYNRYGGRKAIVEYPFNGHEGGQAFQQVEQLRWIDALLGSETPA